MAFATLGTMDLHGTEIDGVRWVISRDMFSGWDSGAASTVAAQQKPRSHGAWTGGAYLRAAHPVLGGTVSAPTPAALKDAFARLKVACSLTPTRLAITEDGATQWAMVQREDEVLFVRTSPTSARWSIQVVQPDPRKFGTVLTGTTGLPSSTGGLTYPYTIPYSIDAVTTAGQVALTNTGNATGPVVLRIDGPTVGPVVTHVGSGLTLRFASSLTLTAGEWITVDMERHEVLAQGQVGRSRWVTDRGWSGFEVGANLWSFTATSGTGTLTVTATEAWE